jgi:hypothetical protein
MVSVYHDVGRWLVGEILMVWMTEVFEASISSKVFNGQEKQMQGS